MQTKVICFANNKGGSGKSTTCANVGYSLAQAGKKVLLIDGDMQLNLSLTYFSESQILEMAQSQKNLFNALKEQESLSGYILNTAFFGIDIIVSSTLMSMVELELFSKWQREFVFKKILQQVVDSNKYDYILVDCPPVLGTWAVNILTASNFVVIPVEASPWGLFGLANMFEFIGKVKEFAPKLELLGIVVNKVDMRKNYFKQTMETLAGFNSGRVFDSFIRLDSTVEWSQDSSMPIGAFKKASCAAKEYNNLALEIDKYASR